MKKQKYYVSMTDEFLSGWGMAKDKINKLVLECNGYQEALTVASNARHRSEMRDIEILNIKPIYDESKILTSWHTKTDYDRWYKPNQFRD